MSIPAPRFINTASYALLLFDYFCTLDREVSWVWPCPVSIGIPLFYINRYIPIVDEMLMMIFVHRAGRASTCSLLYKAATWLLVISSNTAHIIIALQTCALWSNRLWIVCIISAFALAKIIVSIVAIALQLASIQFIEPWEALPPVPGCKMVLLHRYARYHFMAQFISEAVIIGFTFIKALQHMRRSRSSWVSQLYQNGILYCTSIFLLSLINFLLNYISDLPISAATVLGAFQHTAESILCSRVMFVILQHRYDLKQEHDDSSDNHYHNPINLSWFSQGGPNMTSITTTPSELEGCGYGLDSVNESGKELDRRRENDNAAAFVMGLFYNDRGNRKKDEEGKEQQTTADSLRLSVTDEGTGLQSALVEERSIHHDSS